MTPNILMSLPAVLLMILLPESLITLWYVGFVVGFNFMSGVIGMISFVSLYKDSKDNFKGMPTGEKTFLGKFLDILIMILLVWQGHYVLAAMQVLYFALLEGVFASVTSIQKEMGIK